MPLVIISGPEEEEKEEEPPTVEEQRPLLEESAVTPCQSHQSAGGPRASSQSPRSITPLLLTQQALPQNLPHGWVPCSCRKEPLKTPYKGLTPKPVGSPAGVQWCEEGRWAGSPPSQSLTSPAETRCTGSLQRALLI